MKTKTNPNEEYLPEKNIFLSYDSKKINDEFKRISKADLTHSEAEREYQKFIKDIEEFFAVGGIIRSWKKCLILLNYVKTFSAIKYNELVLSIINSFKDLPKEERNVLYIAILKKELHKGRSPNIEFKSFLLENGYYSDYSALSLSPKEIKKALKIFKKHEVFLQFSLQTLSDIKLSYDDWKYIIQHHTVSLTELFSPGKTFKKLIKSIIFFGNAEQIVEAIINASMVTGRYMWALLFGSKTLKNEINSLLIKKVKNMKSLYSLKHSSITEINKFIYNKLIKEIPILAYPALAQNIKRIYPKNRLEAYTNIMEIENNYGISFNLNNAEITKLKLKIWRKTSSIPIID